MEPLTTAERQALLDLLAAHRPRDSEETAHLRHIVDFSRSVGNPFDRSLSSGHLTASAFILDPAGRILLTHHRQLGLWIQLGGHAEEERTAEAVAMREAEEESGLPDLAFHPRLVTAGGSPRLLDVDVHRIPARGDTEEHQHLDLRFLLTTQLPESMVPDLRETRGLAWVNMAEAHRRCEPGLSRALARISLLYAEPLP